MDKIKLLTQAWDLINQAGGSTDREIDNPYRHILIQIEAALAKEFNLNASERN